MNFVPWLVVRGRVDTAALPRRRLREFALPLVVLPVTYFVAAAIILTAGKALGLLPPGP